jgi:cytosine/adenosine deaminase-related metal-dependent hydrolase
MTVILKNARWVYRCDSNAHVPLQDAHIVIDGTTIRAVGRGEAPRIDGAEVVDCTDCIVTPGFINLHHHFFQSITRAMPGLHRAASTPWLIECYKLWAEIEPDDLLVAVRNAAAELVLSGATTSADHAFVLGGVGAELAPIEIASAHEIGLRLHLARSCLPTIDGEVGVQLRRIMGDRMDRLVAPEDELLTQSRTDVARWHDPSFGSMTRLAVGPSNLPYAKFEMMKRFGDISRDTGCGLHAHYHPRPSERAFCQDKQGCQPVEFLDRAGWLRPGTWFAHCTQLDDTDIAKFAEHGVGVSHCPRTVLRLGYQIPRIADMRAAGVPVGFGVDGAASNDGGAFVSDLRLGLLLHRARDRDPVREDAWLDPADALLMATRDAASLLGRDDIGRLAPGLCADIAVFKLTGIEYGGALNDPLGGFLLAGVSPRAWATIVNGRVVVRDGNLQTADEDAVARATCHASAALLERTAARYGTA